MIQSFAWIGTGACDPNKNLKETLIALAVIVSWGVVIYLLTRLAKSKQPTAIKIGVSILAILAAGSATFVVHAFTVIAYSCSRYM